MYIEDKTPIKEITVPIETNERSQSSGTSAGNRPEAVEHSEGKLARSIEEQTAKVPSDVFLWSAMGFAGLSLVLHLSKEHDNSRFFGQWVAPLLVMGVYNKVVKVAGSDQLSRTNKR